MGRRGVGSKSFNGSLHPRGTGGKFTKRGSRGQTPIGIASRSTSTALVRDRNSHARLAVVHSTKARPKLNHQPVTLGHKVAAAALVGGFLAYQNQDEIKHHVKLAKGDYQAAKKRYRSTKAKVDGNTHVIRAKARVGAGKRSVKNSYHKNRSNRLNRLSTRHAKLVRR